MFPSSLYSASNNTAVRTPPWTLEGLFFFFWRIYFPVEQADSVGTGSRCLAGGNPFSCLVHVLLTHFRHFYCHRLGVLMATEQRISVQTEPDILYLSCHQIVCFHIIKHVCGGWIQAVIIPVFERHFKV